MYSAPVVVYTSERPRLRDNVKEPVGHGIGRMAVELADSIQAAGLTDVGRRRKANEDSFTIRTEVGLAVVCDGMGAHDGGQIASRTAAEQIGAFLQGYDPARPPLLAIASEDVDATVRMSDAELPDRSGPPWQLQAVQAAVAAANDMIYRMNVERGFGDGHGMGTTVAGVMTVGAGDRVAVFHVGDSRVYVFRDGLLQRLTKDHSLYEAWLAYGGEGTPPARNVITRAVGPWAEVAVDVSLHESRPGDIYLLCSDGLTGMVPDETMAEVLAALPPDGLEHGCQRLIDMANDKGGTDNITVILAARR